MNEYVGNGVCECGCGETTNTWPQTQTKLGVKKGDHYRFVKGHSGRKPARQATCHPDRIEKARWLCGSCYNKSLINRTEETREKYLSLQSARTKKRKDRVGKEEWSKNQRNRVLKHRYGIGSDDYDRMLEEQDGKCAICGVAGGDTRATRLYVDHNHETREVRKLLCARCNTAVGVIEQGVGRVVDLLKYVSDHSSANDPFLEVLSKYGSSKP